MGCPNGSWGISQTHGGVCSTWQALAGLFWVGVSKLQIHEPLQVLESPSSMASRNNKQLQHQPVQSEGAVEQCHQAGQTTTTERAVENTKFTRRLGWGGCDIT